MNDKSQYYKYLFRLQKSGQTNMFGAVPYLRQVFPELTTKDATNILAEWMNNYDELGEQYKVI
jgi:hypothetical protein